MSVVKPTAIGLSPRDAVPKPFAIGFFVQDAVPKPFTIGFSVQDAVLKPFAIGFSPRDAVGKPSASGFSASAHGASRAQASDIVTYNVRDFRGAERFGIRIVKPEDFLDSLER